VASWVGTLGDAVNAIHFIGGNVDQELAFTLDVVRSLDTPLPVIWNHNATATPDVTLALLDGVVDVYLPDLRYGPGRCAAATGAPVMTFENCTAAIEAELRQGAVVCVRVLGLPGHVECCAEPILQWLAMHRDEVFLNLMSHSYTPMRFALRDPRLNRCLDASEMARLDRLAQELGLRRVG